MYQSALESFRENRKRILKDRSDGFFVSSLDSYSPKYFSTLSEVRVKCSRYCGEIMFTDKESRTFIVNLSEEMWADAPKRTAPQRVKLVYSVERQDWIRDRRR